MEVRVNIDPAFREWITKQSARGAQGFKLFVREGAVWTQLDTYQATATVDQDLWRDAQSNADGFTDMISTFTVKAISVDGGVETVIGSRVISLRQTAGDNYVGEKFEPTMAAQMRLMMEHMDRQARVITQVLPAVTVAATNTLNAVTAHLAQLAESHAEAVRVIKEDRVATIRAEQEGMEALARQERLDKILDQVGNVLPLLLTSGEEAKPS